MTYGLLPSTSGNTTFYVISDNSTVASLLTDLKTNCSSSHLDTSKMSGAPIAYNASDSTSPPPESSVQYYRASSVALSLNGYNNSADFEAEGSNDTPIPSYVDTTLLNCLNLTIGEATPLVDAAPSQFKAPEVGLVALVFIIYHFCAF